jgi:protein-S-isoprenylcysteine O-methyltransferase Ste14
MRGIGLLILLPGLYFLAMSNLALRKTGFGFAAFKLTRNIAAKSVYEIVRNPMSLGTYMAYLGISLIADSSYLLIGTFTMIIPVHLFNLAYFEEHELLARHGVSYSQYMQRVPFILPQLRRAPKNLI